MYRYPLSTVYLNTSFNTWQNPMSSYYTQNNLTIASLRIVLIVKTDISKFIKSFIKPAFTVVSIQEFIDILNEYLIWYNEKQIKISLGNMSPLEYRKSLGLAV